MGLSTSLYAGISGLERQQASLNVIGNNIANVGTYGYKSERVLFNDMLYNTIKSGTAPSGSSGGTNPSQIGSGVDISAIDTNFNQGEIATTGISSDMAIEGNGFFVLSDGDEQVFTRDGAFSLNQERKLVNGATGMTVQGWTQTRDNAGNSTINTGGAIKDVVIPVGDNRVAKATTNFILNGNLNNAGEIASTGTILNSQRLFTGKTGDVEITSGAFDLSDVFIKDPAGGVDNVRLFKGSGVDDKTKDPNVLKSGDQVTVQLMKGGRPLEAIFVYGNGDLVDNKTGLNSPDGTPDAGFESYDGTTLDDFMNWFDQAFGLHASETVGASADSNGAHAVDGDNPNDLVDMGLDATTPFKDETDGSGFEFVLANKGAAKVNSVGQSPQVAYLGGQAKFSVRAGSAADVGIGSSYIDIDGDSAYNQDKDIVLENTVGYVVSGESTVTKGYQATPTEQLAVRSFFTAGADKNLVATTAITGMAYIDVNNTGAFDAGTDMLIKDASAFDATAVTGPFANTVGTVDLVLTSGGAATNQVKIANGQANMDKIAIGQYVELGANRYFVTDSVKGTDGSYTVTFDRTLVAADVTIAAGPPATGTTSAALNFIGAKLVTGMAYAASTTTAAGSTIATTLNMPLGKQDKDLKYQGVTIADVMTDNEASMAGSTFTKGDAVVRIADAPVVTNVTATAANADGKRTDLTVASAAGLKTGMTIVDAAAGVAYTIDAITGTTVTIDGLPANSLVANNVTFSGTAYMDVDGSGTQTEPVYRIHADTTNGMYIDIGRDGAFDTSTTSLDQRVSPKNVDSNLSSFADNAVVHTDSSGNIYRKVPKIYDSTERSVYLDKANKGVYDEVRFNVLQAGSATNNLWVLDDNNDGVVGANDTTVFTTLAAADTKFTSQTASLNRPNSTMINGLSTGSGRIQIRGNIGTVNELSGISFISGVDKVERNVFGASALADATGASYSKVSSATGESVSQNIVVYDSLGKSHDVNMTFVLESKDNDKAVWRWYAETADASRKNGIFPVGDPRGLAPSMNVGSGTVSFDNFGRYLGSTGATANSEALIGIPLEGMDTDSTLNIKPDFSILTSFAASSGSQVDVREQDGFAQGVMDRYTVNADGTVTGIYTNGMTETVAQIALAAFANPDGLTRAGGNLFMLGSNSGNAMIGAAMTGERGAIRGEALEQSNVDITDEFTNMISTQRAYQASARVVTKSDELLQELMQIIR